VSLPTSDGGSQRFLIQASAPCALKLPTNDAGAHRFQADSVQRGVIEQLKAAYFRLSYLQETLSFGTEMTRYLVMCKKSPSRATASVKETSRSTQGPVQHTKILQEITMHHLRLAKHKHNSSNF